MMYQVYSLHINPHSHTHTHGTHMHGTHTQEMLLTTAKKEREESQEYKERRGTLVHGDHLAHKVWEVVKEERSRRREMKILTTTINSSNQVHTRMEAEDT